MQYFPLTTNNCYTAITISDDYKLHERQILLCVQCPLSTPTHMYIHSVILALVLYFVIGAVFLYYGKGARGLEAFPNYGFWKELPIYIKVIILGAVATN